MSINITDWSVITESDFNEMQFDSGFIVKNFNPANFTIPSHSDIVDITSGNIGFTLTPTLVDLGSDVNNLHGVFKELQYISQWSGAQLTYTSLRFSTAAFAQNLGAATLDGNKVTPRMYVSNSDFENIAWIGKKVGGGLAAIVLKNAMSTGGISITTSKDGKGTMSVTMTGFMSINDQTTVPAEFYAIGSSSTLAAITVASAAGTNSGTTKLTLTGYTPSAGESYVYKIDESTAPSVEYLEIPDYTWTAWNGSSDIPATNGYKITVISVNGSGQAVASGSQTVTANTGA